MANPRLIKKRVSSIKNINKITKALEMVAASKVQKAQEKALNAKPFARTIYELVHTFAQETDPKNVPLLRVPENITKTLYILVSTNRGLAGSLNTNLFRGLLDFFSKHDMSEKLFVTVGKKGRTLALSHGSLLADFSEYTPQQAAVAPLIKLVTEKFTAEEIDEVYLVYNDFVSALNQEPTIKKILPLTTKELAEESATDVMNLTPDEEITMENTASYSFEPNADEVLSQLLPFYLETQLTSILLEAEASEHSARMVAMKNASENAQELNLALSLEYNKARQSTITTEINDIVTAGASLKRNEK